MQAPGSVTRRRQVLLLSVLAWTLFVGVSLYKVLNDPTGPTVWIVHEGGETEAPPPERFHAKFKADAGFHRVYPWILFGPYTALVAFSGRWSGKESRISK